MADKGATEQLARDLVARDRKIEHAKQGALFDPLTQLPNRRYFDEVLKREWSNTEDPERNPGKTLTLIEIDVDKFKEINDKHGHPVGDQVLIRLGHILRAAIRKGDFVGRLGGEEFGAILPGIEGKPSKEQIDGIIQRLRKAVETDAGFPPGVNPTISIGAATYPNGIQVLEDLYHKADEALRHAKETGRNQAIEFTNEGGNETFSAIQSSQSEG